MYAIRSYYVSGSGNKSIKGVEKATKYDNSNDVEVNLDGEEVQEFLNNQDFQKMIANPEFAKLVTSADFQKMIVITSYSIHYTKLYDTTTGLYTGTYGCDC